jgi:hypothetical protein
MLSLAAAAAALLLPSSDSPPHSHLMTRRGVLAAGGGLATSAVPMLASAKSDFKWGPMAQMTEEQMDALDVASRDPSAGVLLPSGVRVIDMVVGDGPEPAEGNRVYCHYKIWAGGFRAGKVADWSFYDDRPYDWVLGQPTDRIPAGVDVGTRGMREGGEAPFQTCDLDPRAELPARVASSLAFVHRQAGGGWWCRQRTATRGCAR